MDPVNSTLRKIRLSKASLGLDEKEAVLRPLDNSFLGMGPEVKAFENELSVYLGREVVCVVNGTAALHLAVQACGIGVGDEVLIPSLGYVASFQAVAATGARPIACDIYSDNCMIDVEDAGRRLTTRTRAIMPVHYAGAIGGLDAVYEFAKINKLRVIEDAAHAFGTLNAGKPVGNQGDIVCFSFDGIKNITSGEGGCVVTSDAAVIQSVMNARLLGVENDTLARFSGQRSWTFDVSLQGWRYHMSDIMAAIGRAQLLRRETLAQKRNCLARRYQQKFQGEARVASILGDLDGVVPHIFPVKLDATINRDLLRQNLLEQGIQTGIHYYPNHLLTYFLDPSALPLPVAKRTWSQLITLPLHPDLGDDDVDYVCEWFFKLLG